MQRAQTRVERRSDGWYEPERGIVLPLLQADYYQGSHVGAVVDTLRDLRRRLAELERGGAA